MKTKIYLRTLAKLTIPAFYFLFICNSLNAQNTFPSSGAAGIGTLSPDPSSLLEIKANNKGLLIPRMSKNQRDNISSPATGLLIYQTNNTPGFYYYDGSNWTAVTPKAKSWNLTGNAGTDSSINFLGTSDGHPLAFRVNNSKSGWIDYIGNKNTSLGYQTLLSNTTGANNVAFGFGALKANIAGGANTAIGASALLNNGTGANVNIDEGTRNTAIGAFSMYANTTGLYNTAVGTSSLTANTSGYFNTAMGLDALQSNIDGHDNTATGLAALGANQNGNFNTAAGSRSLQANTTGSNNVADGFSALYSNTSGQQNTASGYAALYSNSSGSYNTATGAGALNNNTGAYNTAHGAYALYLNTSGKLNTASGYGALYSNTSGQSNVAIGIFSLYKSTNASNLVAVGDSALFNQRELTGGEFPTTGNNTAIGSKALFGNSYGHENTAVGSNALYNNQGGSFQGSGNTAMGFQSLITNIYGSSNTAIGANADANNNSYSFSTALGYASTITASYQVRIGNNSVTSIGGYANWTNISDGRVKKNIKANVPGLDFINKLKPVTYNLDLEAADKIAAKTSVTDKDGKSIKVSENEIAARKNKEAVIYTGFVAQDVEKAAQSLNYDFSGVDAAKNDNDLYGLRYAEFVVPLVKAVQELSSKNDDLQKQVDELKAMIVSNYSSPNNQQSTIISSASLDQNVPNPFTNTTIINYTLPQTNAAAQIIIRDKTGKTLKTINISGSGKGSLKVDAATLASGAYSYSLVVNGKLIGTKEMILAK